MVALISVLIGLAQVKVIGHLYQGKEPFEIYEKPDTSSKVYSQGKKGQFVVGNPDNDPMFIRIRLVGGEDGYALASKLESLGQEVTVPADSRSSSHEIGDSGFYYLAEDWELKRIVGRYVAKDLIDLANKLSKEEFALLNQKLEIVIDLKKRVTFRSNKDTLTGRFVYDKSKQTVMVKLEKRNGKPLFREEVYFFSLGIKNGKLGLVRPAREGRYEDDWIFIRK